MRVEEARKLVEKHGSISAAARACKMPRSTLSRLINHAPNVPMKPSKKKAGMSRDEFMREFDPITKTRAAIQTAIEMYVESDRYIKENEMKKLAGINDPRIWRDVVDDPDEGFTEYQFDFGNSRWWTTPESRDEMIENNPKAKAVG